MTKVQALLLEHKIDYTTTEEVVVGKVEDDKGNEIEVTCNITKLKPDDMMKMQKKHSKQVNKNGTTEFEVDQAELYFDLIKTACQDPNFRDIDWQKELGATSPKEAILATLPLSMIMELGTAITNYSGLSPKKFDEVYEETKNS